MKKYHFSASRIYPLAILLLSTVLPLSTKAETIDCTAITSLPYVIATQGVYCLTGNLSTSMTGSFGAIEIQANNVTLDLNGYKLGGLAAGDGTDQGGIYAYQRKNITIKNGIVRGFFRGIWLRDDPPFTTSSGHVVTGILADQNTNQAISVYGIGNTVSHNTVVDTGGTTFFGGQGWGIWVRGDSARVANNVVSNTFSGSVNNTRAIYIASSNYSVVENNTVTDTISDTANSYAIYVEGIGVFVRNNNLANADFGIYFSSGSDGGKYFNNLTFDVTTPFTGGTAIGGNNN